MSYYAILPEKVSMIQKPDQISTPDTYLVSQMIGGMPVRWRTQARRSGRVGY